MPRTVRYDADKSGTMDLGEVNAVIAKLQSMGFSPEPMSAADMADGELDFEEFSAWFLKQEGLPDEFGPPKAGSSLNPAAGKEKGDGIFGKTIGKALKPFTAATKKAVAGPMNLMEASAKMLKNKDDSSLDPDSEAFDPVRSLPCFHRSHRIKDSTFHCTSASTKLCETEPSIACAGLSGGAHARAHGGPERADLRRVRPCLFLTFRCLFLTFRCPSLTIHCLSLIFPLPVLNFSTNFSLPIGMSS